MGSDNLQPGKKVMGRGKESRMLDKKFWKETCPRAWSFLIRALELRTMDSNSSVSVMSETAGPLHYLGHLVRWKCKFAHQLVRSVEKPFILGFSSWNPLSAPNLPIPSFPPKHHQEVRTHRLVQGSVILCPCKHTLQ